MVTVISNAVKNFVISGGVNHALPEPDNNRHGHQLGAVISIKGSNCLLNNTILPKKQRRGDNFGPDIVDLSKEN
jgi:hypothetical protein